MTYFSIDYGLDDLEQKIKNSTLVILIIEFFFFRREQKKTFKKKKKRKENSQMFFFLCVPFSMATKLLQAQKMKKMFQGVLDKKKKKVDKQF